MANGSVLEFLWRSLPNLLIGLPNERPGGLTLSLLLSGGAILFGFPLAMIIAYLETSYWWVLRRVGMMYVQSLRGIPLILLLLLVHQGLGLDLSPAQSALAALTLYASAYYAEVLRAGLLSVPSELLESARVLGAGKSTIFWRVRWQYTLRAMLPGIVNETITIFKDSSVVVVLGVADLMMVARAQLGSNIQNSVYWVPTYLLVGLLYAFVALGLSLFAAYWQKHHRLYLSISEDLAHA